MTDYDLIIIGAGIHGAAIARAAAYDGYNVCVLEQNSKAGQETSSRSSKLIHGGLRYLESYQFRLVKECLRERRILLKTAPSLVKLLPFYIPVYKNSARPAWLIYLGLFIYRLLGGGTIRTVPKSEWENLDGINTHQLVSVFQYYDAVTDDEKLTQAILHQAIKRGVTFRPDTTVTKIQINNDGVNLELNKQSALSSKLVINASGPWVNHVLAMTNPPQEILPIDLVQGSHLVIPRCLNNAVYYVEALDKRVIFAIPWQQHCLLGTTETPFHDQPENSLILATESEYLLSTWNHYFNDHLTKKDIIKSFSGLRVLPSSSASVFRRTRDTLLQMDNENSPKIISIYGGKLTAHRATAESVMKIVQQQLPGHTLTDTSRLNLEP